jgi:N,N'-diacetyllegionaminate synthase
MKNLIFKKTFIIAEAGCNHNGKIEIAFKLIDQAKKCGADAIKFQAFNPDDLVLKNAKIAPYARNKSYKNSQYELQKNISLSLEKFFLLKNYSKKRGIKFICSAFDIKSVNILKQMKLDIIKVPSGEINNLPYLNSLKSNTNNLIFSTGMSSIKEIDFLKKHFLSKYKKKKMAILHCTSSYPCINENVNLNTINLLKEKFNVPIGFSDHTTSIDIPSYAVSMGSKIVEKHFTLSKKMKGPDHFMSLNVSEFKKMVNKIRDTEVILGRFEKKIFNVEKKISKFARKSLVAIKDIYPGDFFNEMNISVKRPGTGISPMNYYKILGKKSKRFFKKDSLLKL